MRIALVAGEASGDGLGAALIEALRKRFPQAEFAGVAGPRMKAAGCVAWHGVEELSVMGLTEVLSSLPRLWRLRSGLRKRILEWRPDVFIGVDFKEFNLGLAKQLKRAGLPTVQYVSPQVWAWRPGRVPKIAASVDAVLCLLPFEPQCYAGQPVHAQFVGHPLADQIPLESQRDAARQRLGLAPSDLVIAVLPGSRMGEVQRLGTDFAAATVELRRLLSQPLHFIAPMASARVAAVFDAQRRSAGADIRLLEQGADDALAAADVALVASGTATLQALLHGCPMVVAYRLAAVTAFLVRDLGLVKLRHFSLPNLLAGEGLVPELFQEAVTPVALASALRQVLANQPALAPLRQRFGEIHRTLRRDSAARAAASVLELLPGAMLS